MTANDRIIGHPDISTRIQKICNEASIVTVGQLASIPDSNLVKFRRFGRTSLNEVHLIREKLAGLPDDSPWRDPSNRLPNDDEPVLVINIREGFPEPFVATYTKGQWRSQDDYPLLHVAMWMPIPDFNININ